MDLQTPTILCEWCHRTVIKAPTRPLRTQAICQACADWAFTHQPLDSQELADVDHIDLPPREVITVSKH